MASRTPMAIMTKKARMMAIKEANYNALRGVAGEYQNGDSKPGVGHVDCVSARINSRMNNERQLWELMVGLGVISTPWEEYKLIAMQKAEKDFVNHWSGRRGGFNDAI